MRVGPFRKLSLGSNSPEGRMRLDNLAGTDGYAECGRERAGTVLLGLTTAVGDKDKWDLVIVKMLESPLRRRIAVFSMEKDAVNANRRGSEYVRRAEGGGRHVRTHSNANAKFGWRGLCGRGSGRRSGGGSTGAASSSKGSFLFAEGDFV